MESNLKFNKKLFLLRVIVLPLWFTMVLIKALYDTFTLTLRFLIGGGELVAMYHDRKTIANIYNKVSELVELEKIKTDGK